MCTVLLPPCVNPITVDKYITFNITVLLFILSEFWLKCQTFCLVVYAAIQSEYNGTVPSKRLWPLLFPFFLNTSNKIIHMHQPSRSVHNHSNSERFWWRYITISNDWEKLFLSDPIKWVDENRFSFMNVFFSEYWTTDKVQTLRISAITAADTTFWNFSVRPFKLYMVGKPFNLNDHCRTVFSLSD